MAKMRSKFKQGLAVYFVVNCFLVAVWFFTSRGYGRSYFWPIWPILGWGLAVVLSYLRTYHTTDLFSAESEFKKLKEKQGG
ncbi:MAG: hypothetical protein EAY75_04120 [Bacteroidetes bacterium]|nr:MAG: hypothetical protein EAY75_04120 [Bacteroidota bacterium]